MIFNLVWAEYILSTSSGFLELLPTNAREKKLSRRERKKKNKKHQARKMHRRSTRHVRHMQKIREAMRQQELARKKLQVSSGGSMTVASGEGMDQDIVSALGAAKQRTQQKVHMLTSKKAKSMKKRHETQHKLDNLRKQSHASRERARRRGKQVFGVAR